MTPPLHMDRLAIGQPGLDEAEPGAFRRGVVCGLGLSVPIWAAIVKLAMLVWA